MSHIKKSFIINVLLITLAITVSYAAARMIRNALTTQSQSADMIKKINALKEQKQELEKKIAEIQTKEAVEREAKERLNLKKHGEEVVVVVPKKKDNALITQPVDFWSRFTSFFK